MSRSPAGLNAGLCSVAPPTPRPFHVAGATLHCRGNLFDEIVEVWDTGASEYHLDLLGACTTFPRTIQHRPRFEVLWRTLITDETNEHETPAPAEYAGFFWNYIVNLDGQVLGRKQSSGESIEDYFVLCDKYLRDLDTTGAAPAGQGPVSSADVRRFVDARAAPGQLNAPHTLDVGLAVWPYIESSNNAASRAMLFRTKEGLMGMCGGPCRVGDGVWLVREAHVPFVLRRDEERVKLVGACFVLDCMQGEMAREPTVDIAIV
jgi:hypothetical protein